MLRSFLLTLLTTLSLTAATFNVSTTPELRTARDTATLTVAANAILSISQVILTFKDSNYE